MEFCVSLTWYQIYVEEIDGTNLDLIHSEGFSEFYSARKGLISM